ncbi:hypothetical protein GCM10020216_068940 [Nonomuraea helvata]
MPAFTSLLPTARQSPVAAFIKRDLLLAAEAGAAARDSATAAVAVTARSFLEIATTSMTFLRTVDH